MRTTASACFHDARNSERSLHSKTPCSPSFAFYAANLVLARATLKASDALISIKSIAHQVHEYIPA